MALSIREFGTAFGNWRSVIGFLMVQEVGQRFSGSRFAAALAFLEPIFLIMVLIGIRGVFRGRLPGYGLSVAVFFSSGVFIFYIFMRVSARTKATKYDAFQRLPRVSSTDLLIASALAEAVLIVGTMLCWFVVLWLWGYDEAVPTSIGDCILPLALVVMLSVGVGLINSAISRHFPFWAYLYGRGSRGLLILSGVFWVVDVIPLFVRDVVIWNPLTHAVEWFRLGLYGTYPVATLDRQYLILWATSALFLGVIAHRATLRSDNSGL